jgi:hypothetical protein
MRTPPASFGEEGFCLENRVRGLGIRRVRQHVGADASLRDVIVAALTSIQAGQNEHIIILPHWEHSFSNEREHPQAHNL